ncbi:hypothetical protein DFH27DRAFT_508918 [Peziza echinospora]|nr:hypothetical protein DFH27DRAFT_508918 [Peziza echinospora]
MGSPLQPRDTTSAFDSPTFQADMSIRVDQPVGSMSISPSGRDVVLASRQGLHIVDLDNPYDPPRFLQHRTAWEVADVQWSPFAARDYWVVSTSNQKAMVWNLAMPSTNAIEHVLHSHTRAITDINFSAHHPDILATCSVDSFVHCWDLRDPRRPATSFCDWFAGATQVKYNRQNEHILASSHDKYLRIWDNRKGAYPLRSICAHTTKIYGVDWNRTRPTGIVTCALDKTIRFWDYSNPEDVPERVIRTSFPTWRARHTPFGWGLLIMPQRADNALYLYDRRAEGDAPADPVEKFEGHTDNVKEFLWRYRGGQNQDRDDREFQLVTWSQDKDIRLWSVSQEAMERVGHNPKAPMRFRITRKGAPYKTFRHEQKPAKRTPKDGMSVGKKMFGPKFLGTPHEFGYQSLDRAPASMGTGRGKPKDSNPIAWMTGVKITKLSSWDNPDTLGEEITMVGAKFPKVNFEKVNVAGRICTVSLHGPWGLDSKWVFLRAEIQFPSGYPESAIPIFTIEKTNTIPNTQIEIMAIQLKKISETYMEHKKMSLEACMKYLLGEPAEHTMAFVGSDEDRDSTSDEEEIDPQQNEVKELIARNNQASVPLPRACGATWSHDGRLVCFFPPKEEMTRREFGGAGCWWNRDLSSSSVGWRENERGSRSGRLFENFGRLYTTSPGPRGLRGVSSPGESSSGSDYETSTSDTDSEDETSTLRPALSWRLQGNAGGSMGRRFYGGRRGGNSTDRSTQRSVNTRVAAMSTGTAVGGGYGGGASGINKGKGMIRLIDLSQVLPSKRELADDYIVYGHVSDVCKHNAEVARSRGYMDLADVWTLANLIVSRDVPLEVVPQPWGKESILVVAKNMVAAMKRRDSGYGDSNEEADSEFPLGRRQLTDKEDMAFENDSDDSLDWVKVPKRNTTNGKIKWGGHPLGGKWLVDKLFSHFEKKGDIQMLAMLSCVFCEAEYKSGDSGPWINIENGNDLLLEMKGPAFSFDYYPTYDAAKDAFPALSVSPQSHSVAVTPLTAHGSYSSSNGFLSGMDPFASGAYSTGNTPPAISTGYFARRSMDEVSHPSLSSSPEYTHQHTVATPFKRASGMANLAGGFARAFHTTSNHSSPPNRKRASPVESMLHTQSSIVTWGANTIIQSGSRIATAVGDARSTRGGGTVGGGSSTLTDTDEEDEDDGNGDIEIKILNSDQFDDEGVLSKPPLLDPRKAYLYRAYREKYADLLYFWGFQVKRLQVLKFNGIRATVDEEAEKLEISIGDVADGFAKKAVKKIERNWTGLEITGTCPKCNNPVDRENPTSIHCRPKHRLPSLTCVVCQVAIRGLYGACLVCGHVAHAKCHRDWFRETECPSGCGCHCMEFSQEGFGFEVPPPPTLYPTPHGIYSSSGYRISRRNKYSLYSGKRRHSTTPTAEDLAKGEAGLFGIIDEDVDEDYFDDEGDDDDRYYDYDDSDGDDDGLGENGMYAYSDEDDEDGDGAGGGGGGGGPPGDDGALVGGGYSAGAYEHGNYTVHVSEYSGL